MEYTDKQISNLQNRLKNYSCEGQLQFNFDHEEIQIEDLENDELERE